MPYTMLPYQLKVSYPTQMRELTDNSIMSIISSDFCRHGKYGGILAEIVLGVNRCNHSSPDCKCTSNQKYARKKTDTYDALRIAVAHRDGRLKPSVCCTREQYALRKACVMPKKNSKNTKYANQMRSLEHLSNAPKWVKKLGKSNYGRSFYPGYLAGHLKRMCFAQ